MRFSRHRLRLYVSQIRALHQSILQEADLAAAFLLALAYDNDLEDTKDGKTIRKAFRTHSQALIEFGGLEEFKEHGKLLGYLVGAASPPSGEEAVCSLDHFSYISHLSAMAWHGLTDRIPTTIFITTPSPNLWRNLSERRLLHILGSSDLLETYKCYRLPKYRPLNTDKIGTRPVNTWTSSRLDKSYQAAFKKLEDGQKRVSTIGRCFLDMVREPRLCGGMHHVIEVFEENAERHMEKIIKEVNEHGNTVEQLRTGYLLEEYCEQSANHPTLSVWADRATRGGSRKLDPHEDYSDEYSEKWALSINV